MKHVVYTLGVFSFLGLCMAFQACSSDDATGTAGTGGAKQDGGTGGKTDGGTGGKGGTSGKGGAAGTATDGAGGTTTDGAGGTTTDGQGGGTIGDGVGGGPGGAGPGKPCAKQGTGGPELMELPQGLCVDATEVTRAQYAQWIATTPDPTKQIGVCSANADFAPDSKCMTTKTVCTENCDNHPQVCVDWCDAVAYCQAVGKRLCGTFGGNTVDGGLESNYEGWHDATQSEWFYACSSDGKHNKYPYGDTLYPHACNGQNHGLGTTIEVGSLSTCQSSEAGFSGVFDLVGNVWEWSFECDGYSGGSDSCRWRGGSFNASDPAGYDTCQQGLGSTRDFHDHSLGFRCCL